MDVTPALESDSRRSSFRNYSSIVEVPKQPRFDADGWELVSTDALEAVLEQLARGPAEAAAQTANLRIRSEFSDNTLLHAAVHLDNAIQVLTVLLDAGLPISVTRYGRRTPLLEAMYGGRIDVCLFLLERGATYDDTDSEGITPMWIAVSKSQPDMVKWLLDEPRLWNGAWDYPLFEELLANMPELAPALLDRFARVVDSKPISETRVDFTCLRQIYGEPTIPMHLMPLALIIQSPSARTILRHPIVMYVLRLKWKTFASTRFRREFVMFLVLLLAFYVPTVAADYRPLNVDSPIDILLVVARAVAVACALFLLLSVERAECAGATPRKYLASFWNWVNLVSYVGVLASVAFDTVDSLAHVRDGVVAVLHVSLWMNLLQFLQVSSQSGLLVAMMTHMIKDVYRFLLLYAVFLLGYSGAFYVLLRGRPGYDSFVNAFITVFLMLFGALDYSVFSADSLRGWSWLVGNTLLLSHLVTVVVMLLNILIAMMTATFEDVWDAAEAEALLIRARAIVRIEKALSSRERLTHFLALIPPWERARYRGKLDERNGSRRTAVVHPEDDDGEDEKVPSKCTWFLQNWLARWRMYTRIRLRALRRFECCSLLLDRICYTSMTLEKSRFRPVGRVRGQVLAPLQDGVRVELPIKRSKQTEEDTKEREMQELREQMALLARSMATLQAKLDRFSDGHLDNCRVLLRHGADPAIGDDTDTPLTAAIKSTNQELVRWLLEQPGTWSRQWDAELFDMLIEYTPRLVAVLLDTFTKVLTHPGESLVRIRYTHLRQLYGDPAMPVAMTPLAKIVECPCARELLSHRAIEYIIQVKWRAFARKSFWWGITLNVILIGGHYVPIAFGDLSWRECNAIGYENWCHVMLGLRGMSWAVSGYQLGYTELMELFRQGLFRYFRSFWNWINLFTYVAVLGTISSEFNPSQQFIRKSLLALISVCAWVSLLPFLQLSETCGLLIILMTKMVKDVYRFLALYVIVLIGYCGLFFVLLHGHDGYDTYGDAFMSVFFLMFVSFDYSVFSSLHGLQWLLAHVLLVSHLVLVVVVLLNILIAMMATTYADVWAAAEAEKRYTQAKTVVLIEMMLKPSSRQKGRMFDDKQRDGHVEQLMPDLEDGAWETVPNPVFDEVDNHGWTPLLEAAQEGQIEVCRVLLACGAIPNLGLGDITPLRAAAEVGNEEMTRWLLQQPGTWSGHWDNSFFAFLLEHTPEAVITYLDRFATELSHSKKGLVGIKYSALKHIYGEPHVPVEDTALALILDSPNARDILSHRAIKYIMRAKWKAFFLLYVVFLIGYSGAFYILVRGSSGYENFVNSFISVFFMLFGAFDYSVFNDKSLTGWRWHMGNFLLISHLIAVVIVLLNILIAMMATTPRELLAIPGQVLIPTTLIENLIEAPSVLEQTLFLKSAFDQDDIGPENATPLAMLEDGIRYEVPLKKSQEKETAHSEKKLLNLKAE
ncbi:hypothetical protein P43SY_009978 [Pythium insidiosum]|uniref:Ion transport domain-containing protein n=1 Tax=Pythium insidiosum TaxID=114742 RepID=A0AAD5Q2I1_PYTIN|nr:hypothetical protein P43SY_009978 [Pythium insidiosum]